jgi:hypothetical protein
MAWVEIVKRDAGINAADEAAESYGWHFGNKTSINANKRTTKISNANIRDWISPF